jgi:hypothetical protein|tara:strand:- start:753 stop:1175 length:423 start_codon:yes stop_codon:yes gene_type:complete
MNLFDWLNEITYTKRDWDSFTEDEQSSFSPYIVHRYVSMYYGYIDIANIAQKLPMTESEKIYTIYKTMLPKKKMFLKYIKNQNKKNYKDITEYVAAYFECGLGEAEHYIDIIQKVGVQDILFKMGVDEKKTKKLLKESKL